MERSNKGLLVLIVILSLLVVGLLGYIVYDKVINVEEDNSKVVDNDKNNWINIEDASLVYEFDKKINSLMWSIGNVLPENVNKKILIDELNTEEKIRMVIRFNSDAISSKYIDLPGDVSDGSYGDYTVYSKMILKNDLLSILLNSGYFSDSTILDNIEYIDGCPSYKYISEYSAYAYSGQCGGGPIYNFTYKFEKNKESNEYYLYKSYDLSFEESVDININNYDNYDKYKFTFKGEKLYSVEKIK